MMIERALPNVFDEQGNQEYETLFGKEISNESIADNMLDNMNELGYIKFYDDGLLYYYTKEMISRIIVSKE